MKNNTKDKKGTTMLDVINRKMNYVIGLLAGRDPKEREKIEDLGFADQNAIDEMQDKVMEESKLLREQLKELQEELEESNKAVQNSLDEAFLNEGVFTLFMQMIMDKKIAASTDPEEVEQLKQLRDTFLLKQEEVEVILENKEAAADILVQKVEEYNEGLETEEISKEEAIGGLDYFFGLEAAIEGEGAMI